MSGAYSFGEGSVDGGGGVARPPVDLTITSRTEQPSKNSNAANHHIVVHVTQRVQLLAGLFSLGLSVEYGPRIGSRLSKIAHINLSYLHGRPRPSDRWPRDRGKAKEVRDSKIKFRAVPITYAGSPD